MTRILDAIERIPVWVLFLILVALLLGGIFVSWKVVVFLIPTGLFAYYLGYHIGEDGLSSQLEGERMLISRVALEYRKVAHEITYTPHKLGELLKGR